MIRIAAPELYDRRPGVLASIAEHVAALGTSAFVLGGETALSHALPAIAASLEGAGIPYETELFHGQPTAERVAELADRLRSLGAVVVIGIGGGKALDTAKAAGVLAGRPIVTVPTVPATCAAWAALSILYSEAGEQVEIRWLPYGPRRILADPDILAAAPPRFLVAGIADTVVKWYESAPNLGAGANPLALRLQASFGAFTLETIDRALAATDGGLNPAADAVAQGDLFDAVVALAGLCGSVRGARDWGGFAHPFYVAATRLPETHRVLHGAIVGFGLFVQWVLEGRTAAEITPEIAKYGRFGVPTTLADLGIVADVAAKVGRIAADAAGRLAISAFAGKVDAEGIAAATLAVDAIGRRLKAGERAA